MFDTQANIDQRRHTVPDDNKYSVVADYLPLDFSLLSL